MKTSEKEVCGLLLTCTIFNVDDDFHTLAFKPLDGVVHLVKSLSAVLRDIVRNVMLDILDPLPGTILLKHFHVVYFVSYAVALCRATFELGLIFRGTVFELTPIIASAKACKQLYATVIVLGDLLKIVHQKIVEVLVYSKFAFLIYFSSFQVFGFFF